MRSGKLLALSVAGLTSSLILSGCFADATAVTEDTCETEDCSTGETPGDSTGGSAGPTSSGPEPASTGPASTGPASTGADSTGADSTGAGSTGAGSTGAGSTGAGSTTGSPSSTGSGESTSASTTSGVEPPECGNAILEDGEACDEGVNNSDTAPDACRTNCQVASCGDAVLDDAEACDDGVNNSDAAPNACRTNCQVASCGDAVLDDAEDCDDGVNNSDAAPNACRTNCQVASCGDAVLDDAEDCDTDAVGCLADCSFDAPDFGVFPEAVAVIGQPDMTSNGANALGVVFNFPAGVLSHEGRVLVGEAGTGVFIFDSVPAVGGVIPDAALGLDGVNGAALPFGPSSVGSFVRGFSTDGTRLAITDRGGPRILLFDAVPATSTPANVVVGQPDFQTQGGGLSQDRLLGPRDVSIGGGRMAVADFDGNRVLLWNAIPETNGALPDVVLGQAAFDEGEANRGGAVGPDTLNRPVGVWTDGERLAVSDHLNHRVLLWDSFPTQNGQPADHVVGQVDATSRVRTGGSTGLSNPFGVTFVGDRMYLVDQFNHRVLIYEGWLEEDGVAADGLVGHSSFESSAPNDQDEDGSTDATSSSQTMNRPSMLHFADGQLFVADAFNHRVVVFEGM